MQCGIVSRKVEGLQMLAPLGGGFGGTLWGSAGITVPWEVYQQYGDIRILQDNYQAMKRYIDLPRY